MNLGKFITVPAGKFTMGSPKDEPQRFEDEVQREVEIKEFELCETLVIQSQWQEVMGSNPSYFKGVNLPVEQVSHNDIQEFISKLNVSQTEYVYRLPTEEEWEYACRSGTATAYFFGEKSRGINSYAWFYENSGMRTHPVKEKKPNPWGFYDILGNVWELTSSLYEPTGSNRVIRGGGWNNYVKLVRSARRNYVTPDYVDSDVGFRLARNKTLPSYTVTLSHTGSAKPARSKFKKIAGLSHEGQPVYRKVKE